jgi:uncharacterized membrane protein YidH (DUF202 family)
MTMWPLDPGAPAGNEEEPDYHFTLANERTFLVWIRTALALIAGTPRIHQQGVGARHLTAGLGDHTTWAVATR